ncbi:hypothetical protein F3Y22_tig00112801pilonHSYRG00056 [Hibiscus syriacus]|uniref:Integrase catalytic domain-containing protein n=1 Tax=Hibiscus syriacus TaxID=106335 RepID=A0A6A2XQQ0_HIBSY|nr:hypothetical protein F3Y22_tig00112801pilonHSYRG00056 [Hibiscus syriacus]
MQQSGDIRVGAMAADEGNVKIEKFGGADFGFWKMQIEDFLYQKNLYQHLSIKQPDGKDHGGSYDDSLQASAAQHLNELNIITTQLSSVEIEIDDEVRALILLSSLPDSWNTTVTTVSSSSGNSKLKFDDVRDLGHFKRDCRALKKDTDAQESANMTEETGQLDGEGYSTTFSGCEWKITKGALVISRGKKTDTLYVTSNLENIIVVTDADGKSNLWHQRLSHMSEKGMKTLLRKGKLPDLKNVDVGLCEDCIFGKQKKVSFAKISKTPKAEKLESIHTDVWGPFPVPSLAMMENETGLKVKRLRSDNGGEYKNSRFRDFYKNNGIKMETIIPMTLQQNGVAERMNRTMNERARSMRIHARLSKLLWAEAINTAAYLINREPSVPLDGGITEEAWSKKEINLSHLRVFGCISYVHINSAERSKLDAKSNKCVFVGYGGDEFGYRFWDYENRKIIRNRDVIFNENVMYKERSTIELSSSNTGAETNEFVEFEEISGNDVQISPGAVQKEPDTPELRRSSRIPKPTQRYSPSLHYLLLTDNDKPECYDEAIQTWELTELPPGKKALHNKWIYRIKEEDDGSKRYKPRLVVKGFQQKEGIDYNEIFSPVVKLSTIRLPEGFIEADKKNLVCRLKKRLYGLKQAPRQWYKKFDSFMSSSGFTRCQTDHCCCIKRFDNNFIILLLYVDDMLVAGSDMQEIINLKQKLSKQFAMKDLSAAKYILRMRIKRDTKSRTLMLSQAEYINKVLSRFNMQNAKPVSTPLGVHFRLSKEQSPKTEEERTHMVKMSYASTIGSLMYAMFCTRPDIAHAVGVVSWYMNNPGKEHYRLCLYSKRYCRTKIATICGLLRDSSGHWLGGFNCTIGFSNALQAELWAIHDSLCLAWDLGYRLIQIRSDCQKAIAIINDPNALSCQLPLVRVISLLKLRSWELDITWTY